MSKYPYIADKKLYAAVMFACKMIREDGYFNQACQTAASYYNVDVDEVEKQVRLRQAAGQRGKKRGPMKWFIICDTFGDYRSLTVSNFRIKRGKSKDTVTTSNTSSYWEMVSLVETGVSQCIEVVGEYDSKDEATEAFCVPTIESFLKGLSLEGYFVFCNINTSNGIAKWDNSLKKFV